jgi:hypothetical protein
VAKSPWALHEANVVLALAAAVLARSRLPSAARSPASELEHG